MIGGVLVEFLTFFVIDGIGIGEKKNIKSGGSMKEKILTMLWD